NPSKLESLKKLAKAAGYEPGKLRFAVGILRSPRTTWDDVLSLIGILWWLAWPRRLKQVILDHPQWFRRIMMPWLRQEWVFLAILFWILINPPYPYKTESLALTVQTT